MSTDRLQYSQGIAPVRKRRSHPKISPRDPAKYSSTLNQGPGSPHPSDPRHPHLAWLRKSEPAILDMRSRGRSGLKVCCHTASQVAQIFKAYRRFRGCWLVSGDGLDIYISIKRYVYFEPCVKICTGRLPPTVEMKYANSLEEF